MTRLTDQGLTLAEHAPLAPMTTLGTGGPARYLAQVGSTTDLADALEFARRNALRVLVIGGGSNLVVADTGFDGMVLGYTDRTLEHDPADDDGYVRVGAGCDWDDLVAWSVDQDLAGIECLSGIPGKVGAAPIQNIGAYGQEVAETIVAVHAVDRTNGRRVRLTAEACGFGYRTSRFKTEWLDRYVITRVDFRLRRGGAPQLRYEELRTVLGATSGGARPSLRLVRETVVAIRRRKSMVIDTKDPNRRSAGSFFLNPVVTSEALARVEAALGPERAAALPRWPQPDGRIKLPAAWLIEEAGVRRGFALGPAAVSSQHALALVNRGTARSSDILALAAFVRRRVRTRFGLTLATEPIFAGFDRPADVVLDRFESALPTDPEDG